MTVFIIIQAYFGLGALLFTRVPRTQRNWIKFLVYLIVVNLVVVLILLGKWYFTTFSVAIVLWAYVEINFASARMRSSTDLIKLVYLLLGLGFIAFSRQPSEIVLYAFLGVFLFDGFSQLSGQIFGRTKLAPRISPGKTWEGTAGGALLSITSLYLLRDIALLKPQQSLIWGGIIAISSLSGDLLASAVKRRARIKDFGKILPGHGGILDRFDSFIFCGAVLSIVLIIWN